MHQKIEIETIETLKDIIGENILNSFKAKDNVDCVVIDRNHLLDIVRIIRDNAALSLKYLNFITAVDYLEQKNQFHIVYHFTNLENDNRLRLILPVPGKDAWIPSITSVYPSANWHEREMMEMFGIEVKDHPDPRKLLLPDWVNENPLRKSFPHGGEELWKFHQRTIEMFNVKNEYQGRTDDPWLERMNE